jgi:hypothetical protein
MAHEGPTTGPVPGPVTVTAASMLAAGNGDSGPPSVNRVARGCKSRL